MKRNTGTRVCVLLVKLHCEGGDFEALDEGAQVAKRIFQRQST